MRFLVFHGYLLRGTGSNVYNAELARALVAAGHEVHLLCQDRRAAELPFVDAVGRFDGGELHVDALREPVRLTAYLPDIGRTLPVYVADRYEFFDAVTFAELDDAALERYLDANVAAVRAVVRRARPAAALTNHVVMGPAILARALAGGLPYAVKVHGSALEYTVRPDPARFLPFAREGLAGASGILVGSAHTGRALLEVVGNGSHTDKLRLGPPGVDTSAFRPLAAAEAHERISALAARVSAREPSWGSEAGAADALRTLDPTSEPIVTYVGKLIVSKGVDLLLAAWPLVCARVSDARLCIVGFGAYRDGLAELARALGRGDLTAALRLAERGRAVEGGPPGQLRYLTAFLRSVVGGEHHGYLEAAGRAFERVHFTGRLEHEDLPGVLAGSLAQIVPSTFPEAFGMVAVEAAACGALPLCADHSGLAEVTRALAPALDPEVRGLLSFQLGDHVVAELGKRLVMWLELPPSQRERARSALAARATGLYSWGRVATTVVAAARGELDGLPSVDWGAGTRRRASG